MAKANPNLISSQS